MIYTVKTGNKKCAFLLDISINSNNREEITIIAKDAVKENTFYFNQTYRLGAKEAPVKIFLPQSPEVLHLIVFNTQVGNKLPQQDTTFSLTIKQIPLEAKTDVAIIYNPLVKRFISFAQKFCEYAGVLPINRNVLCENEFRVDFYDTIRDLREWIVDEKLKKYVRNPNYYRELSTPARINKTAGIIEVSKRCFIGYTVPQRFMIMSHEFAHFFYNRKANNEEEADFNACLIYLALGYPRIEGLDVWTKVFFNAATNENIERYIKIKNFINKFDDFNFKIV